MIRSKIVLLFLLVSSVIFAQDFEVSPVLMNFNADAGEIQKQQINLINHASTPQKYTLKITDYVVDKDGNKKPVAAGTNKRSCADWITVSPAIVELSPNKSAAIDVLMTVPKNGFNGRWCMIQVETAKENTGFDADKSLSTGVSLVPRIVVLVKQTPKSSKDYKATISNMREVTKSGETIPSFGATIANTGENIIEASVSINVANIQTGQEEKFAPTKFTVYPEGVQDITLTLPKKLPRGRYAVAAVMDFGHRQPLAGTQMMLEVK